MAKRKHQKVTAEIPWTSFGRETVATKIGRSLTPVGLYPFELKPFDPAGTPAVDLTAPGAEDFLMNIVGTAIQAADGKMVTCAHVVDALFRHEQERPHYVLSRVFRDGMVYAVPYRIHISVPYIDDRTGKANPTVDLAVLAVPARGTAEVPYETPAVRWGDSARLGVGDPVVVGGYPYGREMFLYTQSNRGLIQPTFYSGIVSAILPATAPNETRLLQISVPVAGGMSGGAVFLPGSGEVVGMVTSCVHAGDIPLPMSYAVPSEVIVPFVENLSFGGGEGAGKAASGR